MIPILISSFSVSAGTLAFMTSKGVTDVADNAQITRTQTAISTRGDGMVSISLSLIDSKNRTCGLDEQVFPKADYTQLAVTAVEKNITIVCEVNKPNFPVNGSIDTAVNAWIFFKK